MVGTLSQQYQPLCASAPECRSEVNTTCYSDCEPCTRMFKVIPGSEKGDYRFTRYFFIQSSIQLSACIVCLAFHRYSSRKSSETRSEGSLMAMSAMMLPAHYGLLIVLSVLSFFNFLMSVAFAVIEHTTEVTYTFTLYTPSALGVGQMCGVLLYLMYPGAGKAAISRFWMTFAFASTYYVTCYSIVMEQGRPRALLIIPITVDILCMVGSFIMGIIPNSVIFRRTGFRRLSLLFGICCSSCSYCSFILQHIFFNGMVQPIIVLWSLLLDSLYWLGMTNEMADASDLHSHDKGVGIDRPLVGISFDHEAASELAQSLGSRSMRQLLGSGGTAKVYKGVYKMDRDSAKNCAVKVSFFVEFNADVIREVIREAELCGNIRHPRVVEFYGISVMPPSIALVFELCEHGSLEKFLRRGIGRMNEKNKLLLCLDCAVAVEYLHSIKSSDGLSFSHGDLKSPNFLVTRSGVVKLSDLATCSPSSTRKLDSSLTFSREDDGIPQKTRPYNDSESLIQSDFTQIRRVSNMNKLVGDSFRDSRAVSDHLEQNLRFAPQWTAPEMLRTPLGTSSLASDIYSLGVVFWEIFHQAEPFGDQPNLNSDPSELVKKIERRQIALKFDSKLCEPAMVQLFDSMTAFQAHQRPSASEVCRAVLKMIDHENPEIYRIDLDPRSSSRRLSVDVRRISVDVHVAGSD